MLEITSEITDTIPNNLSEKYQIYVPISGLDRSNDFHGVCAINTVIS